MKRNRPDQAPRWRGLLASKAERLDTCDDAIVLLREIADLQADDNGDVILGADANGHNDLLSRIAGFLAIQDQ